MNGGAMKILKAIAIGAVVLFAAIQLHRPERVNPPVDPSRTLQAQVNVSPEAAAILDRACRDCHSHETRWPWYSHVAPVMWWLADHVDEGREHLNLSDWSKYDARRADRKLDEICEEATKGHMPLRGYPFMHPEARLTEGDVRALCVWTEEARRILAATRIE
jgi:hypothetical protein